MPFERERFSASELAACLSHYDLGIIRSVYEFARGSRRSPKVLIDCERGRFLFKRRVHGKDDVKKVAFTHRIQLYLSSERFPLPRLVPTRHDGDSVLVTDDGRIYEMFEFVEGQLYSGSAGATSDAGRILGLYHKLLADFRGDYEPPGGSYHAADTVGQAIGDTVTSLPLDGRPGQDVLMGTVGFLERAYLDCAGQADKAGLKDWPVQIVHGDWHPGNMLFRDDRVAAVIDYDTARMQQRVIDLANGAIQFSIIGGPDDPSAWPDHPDMARLKQFMAGYDSINAISKGQSRAIPFLMCEAMIAEAVLPIAATGSFGRMQGFPFLQMIRRKVDWVLGHVDEIETVLNG